MNWWDEQLIRKLHLCSDWDFHQHVIYTEQCLRTSRIFYFYHNHQLELFKPPRTDTTVSLRMLINFIIHPSLTDACYSDFFLCSKRTLSHALLNLFAMFPQCSLLGSSEISHMQSGRTMKAEGLLSSLWIPVFILFFFRQKVSLFIIIEKTHY